MQSCFGVECADGLVRCCSINITLLASIPSTVPNCHCQLPLPFFLRAINTLFRSSFFLSWIFSRRKGFHLCFHYLFISLLFLLHPRTPGAVSLLWLTFRTVFKSVSNANKNSRDATSEFRRNVVSYNY